MSVALHAGIELERAEEGVPSDRQAALVQPRLHPEPVVQLARIGDRVREVRPETMADPMTAPGLGHPAGEPDISGPAWLYLDRPG
jgi:hypothetical protein